LAHGWPTLEAFEDLPCQLANVEPRLKKLKETWDYPNFNFPQPHQPDLKPRLKKFEEQQLVALKFEKWWELSQLGIDVREALVLPKERELAKDPRLGRWRCELLSPLRRSWTQLPESC